MNDLLLKRWKFIPVNSDEGVEMQVEDDSIFTVDNDEVVGCSEWMRADHDVMEYIVNLHNSTLTS